MDIYPKVYKSSITQGIINHFIIKTHAHIHMFIVALFTIAKTWNQPKCPSMIDWIRNMWHICTMEYYAAIWNNEFMSFVGTGVNLETIILSKLTQGQKNYTHAFTHRWVSNNENTWKQEGEHHTLGSVGEKRGGTTGGREVGEGYWGEKYQI